jgi:hypothetical protein
VKAECELAAEKSEEGQGSDLNGETNKHDVNSQLSFRVGRNA